MDTRRSLLLLAGSLMLLLVFSGCTPAKVRLALPAEDGKSCLVRQKAYLGIVAAGNDPEPVEETTGRGALECLKPASHFKAYKADVPVAR